ncbi:hypothetical protein [Streptococcus sp. Marseille-Q8145]
MEDMKYFIPNSTYDDAIKNKEVGVLRGLLIGIIGSDPTFSTREFSEAKRYIKEKSIEYHGEKIKLTEPYVKQEDEYEKEMWDEDYYKLQLVWFRDNFAKARFIKIKEEGKIIYKDKMTYGKAKLQNRLSVSSQSKGNSIKKESVVIATGNDEKKKRLSFVEWTKKNWWWILILVALIASYFILFGK